LSTSKRALSLLTVLGEVSGDRYHADEIMWRELLATMALFGYVMFLYRPIVTTTSGSASILNPPTPNNTTEFVHIMVWKYGVEIWR
jgi:hypothetical protein